MGSWMLDLPFMLSMFGFAVCLGCWIGRLSVVIPI